MMNSKLDAKKAGDQQAFEDRVYPIKSFNLSGLQNISDRTLEMHFKLYEGYVKQTNQLNERLSEYTKNGHVESADFDIYSELTRRLGFEYNGMILHEYYFANLKKFGSSDPHAKSLFLQAAQSSFGSYQNWQADFVAKGKMRGIGWVICFQDPQRGHVSNHWISSHEIGNVAGFTPVLVMDVWEHAYLLDFQPSERPKYIDAFFANINWETVERRVKPLQKAAQDSSNRERI
jgi:superoxide dismutase, Fe-Mn family